MVTNKTIQTVDSVTDFINIVADERKRADCFQIVELCQSITGFPPGMWGATIIGFGNYHYIYDTGREGDMPIVGFSPRATAIVLYLTLPAEERVDFLQRLGKYKTGKSCIYIKKLSDVNIDVLKEMIAASVRYVQQMH